MYERICVLLNYTNMLSASMLTIIGNNISSSNNDQVSMLAAITVLVEFAVEFNAVETRRLIVLIAFGFIWIIITM